MKKNINIAIIGTAGIPACYGGFETLVENLTRLSSNNIRYTVYCSSTLYKSKKQNHNNAELYYVPLNANGIQSIFYDGYSIFHSIFHKRDIILILGVSGCIFLPLARLFSKTKIITNIDGLEWKRSKWGNLTRRFLKFSEYLAMKYSDIIITDNQEITNYALTEYNKNTVTIAYGGDHALLQNRLHEKPEENYYLSICRIEPENNIEMILKAFSKKRNSRLKI
ncbi:DUF1972 domain-containing protein [Providencia sp. PROV132]|uniref:DUF1972 domain-containing protein n=1 Tax=Providencia sp. PROV132 TaxID=2949842 RepID=UPI002349DBC1|nr:DUF1972 domain-containing protein [Providencia sp. PROV132]